MAHCEICSKSNNKVNQHEFYFGRTIDDPSANWNSDSIYLVTSTKSYAVNERPIKGYLCSSCVKTKTLKTHIYKSAIWLMVMIAPWVLLYLIGRHMDTNQTAYLVFYATLILILAQILSTILIFGMQPRKLVSRILSPFSVLLSKKYLEKHGDMLLAKIKQDALPRDVDTFLSRQSFSKMSNPV